MGIKRQRRRYTAGSPGRSDRGLKDGAMTKVYPVKHTYGQMQWARWQQRLRACKLGDMPAERTHKAIRGAT